jgi:hypothetical protein
LADKRDGRQRSTRDAVVHLVVRFIQVVLKKLCQEGVIRRSLDRRDKIGICPGEVIEIPQRIHPQIIWSRPRPRTAEARVLWLNIIASSIIEPLAVLHHRIRLKGTMLYRFVLSQIVHIIEVGWHRDVDSGDNVVVVHCQQGRGSVRSSLAL